ncbi:MAG: ABC transporter substrate-binding protein [Deltaproteobacteria bacterium]|nr:ABC transporter substrate-binding protein [Deltaproteobacteria bacterium]
MRKLFSIALFSVVCIFLISGINSAFAAEKVKKGGVLKFAHSKTAGIIGNPLKIRGWNHEFVDNTLQTLLFASNDKIGEVTPLLAESYELAPDKSHYIFKLRKGVKFHDGTDCKAQAVKWNHDMWVKSKRPTMSNVTSIDIIDDYTIKYNIKSWDAISIWNYCKDTFIISPTAWEKNGPKWVDYNPVGTGPFKLVGQKRNSFLKFDKFKGYWSKGLPYLDGLHIVNIADPMTAQAALYAKEVDAWLGVDNVSASQAIKKGELGIQQFDAIYNVIQFNSMDAKSPWSNKKLREAMEYAIDKEAIVKSVNRGMATPVYSVIHSINKIAPGAGTTPRKYNPEKAKQLVKEAGHPNGLKVKMLYSANPVAKDTVIALQGYLGAIGIQIMPSPLVGAAFHEVLFKPTPHSDLILGNLRGGASEILTSASENFGRGSVFFQSVQKPDGFQDLIAEALSKETRKEIAETLFKAERLAYAYAMDVPLIQAKFAALMQPYVKNAYWFWGGRPYPNLQKTWLDK